MNIHDQTTEQSCGWPGRSRAIGKPKALPLYSPGFYAIDALSSTGKLYVPLAPNLRRLQRFGDSQIGSQFLSNIQFTAFTFMYPIRPIQPRSFNISCKFMKLSCTVSTIFRWYKWHKPIWGYPNSKSKFFFTKFLLQAASPNPADVATCVVVIDESTSGTDFLIKPLVNMMLPMAMGWTLAIYIVYYFVYTVYTQRIWNLFAFSMLSMMEFHILTHDIHIYDITCSISILSSMSPILYFYCMLSIPIFLLYPYHYYLICIIMQISWNSCCYYNCASLLALHIIVNMIFFDFFHCDCRQYILF